MASGYFARRAARTEAGAHLASRHLKFHSDNVNWITRLGFRRSINPRGRMERTIVPDEEMPDVRHASRPGRYNRQNQHRDNAVRRGRLEFAVTRDLPQFWPVQASVQYLPNPKKIPAGVWPVKLVKSLPPGEGGFHLDKHNQPYAEVIANPGDDSWSIDASHETIEMLVDPNGNRMQSSIAIEIAGKEIEDSTGQFNYLVEACDPCEANNYGYQIMGVLVSDFITPRFYDSVTVSGARYSFTGALTKPRQILPVDTSRSSTRRVTNGSKSFISARLQS
jgi:hypothetical protein